MCEVCLVLNGLCFVVVKELESRRSGMGEPSHVINIDIQDNHEEATIGAFMICDLCSMVSVNHTPQAVQA